VDANAARNKKTLPHESRVAHGLDTRSRHRRADDFPYVLAKWIYDEEKDIPYERR
jgi:hypothetical protein